MFPTSQHSRELKDIIKKFLASVSLAALAASALGFGGVAVASAAPVYEPKTTAVSEASLEEALATVDTRATPIEVRVVGDVTESDYAIGDGSVLTVVETAGPSASGGVGPGGMMGQVSFGRDQFGFYIDLSPADQRSFLGAGSGFLLGAIALLVSPIGGVALAALGNAIGPQLETLFCAGQNKTQRFYYTLDGNVTNTQCV